MKSSSIILLILTVSFSAIAQEFELPENEIPNPLFSSEKILLQGVTNQSTGLGPQTIYQVGSQVFIQLHNGIFNAMEFLELDAEIIELTVPSFVVQLTTEFPSEDAKILYENGTMKSAYTIDQKNPWVNTYDLKGEWNVSNYPWVYSEHYGYCYIFPIQQVTLNPPQLSYYTRWIYSENFGWINKLPFYLPTESPVSLIPLHRHPIGLRK